MRVERNTEHNPPPFFLFKKQPALAGRPSDLAPSCRHAVRVAGDIQLPVARAARRRRRRRACCAGAGGGGGGRHRRRLVRLQELGDTAIVRLPPASPVGSAESARAQGKRYGSTPAGAPRRVTPCRVTVAWDATPRGIAPAHFVSSSGAGPTRASPAPAAGPACTMRCGAVCLDVRCCSSPGAEPGSATGLTPAT